MLSIQHAQARLHVQVLILFQDLIIYQTSVIHSVLQLKGKDGGEPIGRISKQWTGLVKEALTDTDNFGIQFPLDLDVKMKAVLLGACFLIVRHVVLKCYNLSYLLQMSHVLISFLLYRISCTLR